MLLQVRVLLIVRLCEAIVSTVILSDHINQGSVGTGDKTVGYYSDMCVVHIVLYYTNAYKHGKKQAKNVF